MILLFLSSAIAGISCGHLLVRLDSIPSSTGTNRQGYLHHSPMLDMCLRSNLDSGWESCAFFLALSLSLYIGFRVPLPIMMMKKKMIDREIGNGIVFNPLPKPDVFSLTIQRIGQPLLG